ncbi:cytochrome c [Cardiobacterium sp. AH-315-I02]|nr:cytochrome c [Cardiobacterium sp. AH-315-I02]
MMSSVHGGDFFKGQTIYATYCQACHGSNGRGTLAGTPDFRRSHALMKADAQLYEIILNGRIIMPGFRGVLKNDDMYDVISYLRSFH